MGQGEAGVGFGLKPLAAVAFLNTAKGADLMTDSPAPVTPRQLRDLYLEVKAAKKE